MLRNFRSSESGNVAILFAFALFPLAAAAGAAVDYSRAATLKAELQSAADATALAQVLASDEGRTIDINSYFAKEFSSGVDHTNLKINGNWTIAGKRYRVTASADAPTTFMSFFVPKMDVGVATTAELNVKGVNFELDVVDMDPEAGDYNQLFVYCYKPPKNGTPGKRNPVTIDNLGTKVDYLKIAGNDANDRDNPPKLPDVVECAAGETLSVRMHNIRDGNSNPSRRATAAKYDYYTDTTITDGKAEFHTQPDKMIESIFCAGAVGSQAQYDCTHKTNDSPPGKIPPQQRSRLPQVANKACSNDGYLYMGWEDRPPDGFGRNQTASDEDYDDIRVILRCEQTGTENQMKARLVE